MKKFFNESGQTLVFVALGMTVMLGFVGFATDVGVLLHEKREVQTAADSAAIAGALQALAEGGAKAIDSNITAAAKNDAALNGFTDGVNGATVTVVMTPNITVSTFNAYGYVQATVTQNTPDFFMKLFGFNSMNVTATAVATELGEKAPCMVDTNYGNVTPAVYLSGNSLLAGHKCGVAVNGNIQFNGGKATIQAGSVEATGSISGNAGVSITGPYASGVPPAADPLATTLQNPANQPCVYGMKGCAASTPNTCSSPDGSACWYDYGLNSAGTGYAQGVTGTANVTGSTLPAGGLPAGVYYYDIPVNFSGQISGSNVMFYLANTVAFDFAANGTMGISAPTSGLYANILIDAPTDGPWTTCKSGKGNNSGNPGELYFDFGSSTTTLNGTVYAPWAQLFVQDSGATMTLNDDLVIGSVCMQSATFSLNGLAAPTYSTKVGLVY